MPSRPIWLAASGLVLALTLAAAPGPVSAAPQAGRPLAQARLTRVQPPAGGIRRADARLSAAISRLVGRHGGPPGVAVVVQRGREVAFYRAGTANLASHAPMRASDVMRQLLSGTGRRLEFRPGRSEPPGPGRNAAGLAIFRYQTRCGTVYGHTGNTAGYTQFAAATRNGQRSVVVTVNAQITQAAAPARFAELRQIYTLAVCAALAA